MLTLDQPSSLALVVRRFNFEKPPSPAAVFTAERETHLHHSSAIHPCADRSNELASSQSTRAEARPHKHTQKDRIRSRRAAGTFPPRHLHVAHQIESSITVATSTGRNLRVDVNHFGGSDLVDGLMLARVAAEDTRTASKLYALPNALDVMRVTFRLPNNLAVGACQVKLIAHDLSSNIGTIRIN